MARRTKVLAGVLVVVLIAGALAGLRLLTRQEPTRFAAVFSNTVGLYPGSDVRILGLPVGTVTTITPAGTQVMVEMELDGDQKASAGTGAVIVAPTLVSDRYVQLTKPWTSGEAMADGTVIKQDQTATPVEIDQLYKSLDDLTKSLGPDGANKDGSLSRLVAVGADNLRGNGKQINTLLREFGKFTGTLSGSDQDLFKTVSNFKDFNDTLVANDRGVAQVNRQLADVTGYLADDRGDLQRAIKNLGQALAVIDDFIRANRGNLTASVRKLIGPTQTLVRQRQSLEETVRVLPLTLQNFLNTYDYQHNTLDSRLDLNELTLWARQHSDTGGGNGGGSGSGSSPSASPSASDSPSPTGSDSPSESGSASQSSSPTQSDSAGSSSSPSGSGTPLRSPSKGASASGASSSSPPVLLPGLEGER